MFCTRKELYGAAVQMTAAAQASLSCCSWPVLLPENLLAQTYYNPCPSAQWSSWQRTLGWVDGGTRVLNNLYVEHVFRRNMRNTRTYLIWHSTRTLSSLRRTGVSEKEKVWNRKVRVFSPWITLSYYIDCIFCEPVQYITLKLINSHIQITIPCLKLPFNLWSDSFAIQTHY